MTYKMLDSKTYKVIVKQALKEIKSIHVTVSAKYGIVNVYVTQGDNVVTQVELCIIEDNVNSVNGSVKMYEIKELNRLLKLAFES